MLVDPVCSLHKVGLCCKVLECARGEVGWILVHPLNRRFRRANPLKQGDAFVGVRRSEHRTPDRHRKCESRVVKKVVDEGMMQEGRQQRD